jgi:hypothetical protein
LIASCHDEKPGNSTIPELPPSLYEAALTTHETGENGGITTSHGFTENVEENEPQVSIANGENCEVQGHQDIPIYGTEGTIYVMK